MIQLLLAACLLSLVAGAFRYPELAAQDMTTILLFCPQLELLKCDESPFSADTAKGFARVPVETGRHVNDAPRAKAHANLGHLYLLLPK